VAPVSEGKEGRKQLEAAIAAHQTNKNVHETSRGIEYRDQQPANKIIHSMDAFSPHFHAPIQTSKAAVLSLSGWRDGAYPHASIRRFLNLQTSVNRLILGPWDHGGKHHITPGKSRPLQPDIVDEAIKFFDHYLKGYPTGIDQQPRVQYYTMQAERWQVADTWPPPGYAPTPYYLHANGKLAPTIPSEGSISLVHDGTQGTGEYTRWRGLRLSLGTGELYPDRKFRDEKLAVFDSDRLTEAVEVTGHSQVHLYIRTAAQDGAFFVYLEDITPGGEVWYVTEGELRALHRKVCTSPPPYHDVVPYHSYLREDACPLPAGEVVELCFDLLPVSYLFQKGHRIRIAIATGDKDNFKEISERGATYELILGETRVVLPTKVII